MPTIREGFVFCWVYIYIVYIMPSIGDIFVILLGFFGPFGPWVWGDVNQFKFTLILSILCQQLKRSLYFVGFTYILYISCQQLERYLYIVGFLWALRAQGMGGCESV